MKIISERGRENGPDNTAHGQSLQPAGACSKSALVIEIKGFFNLSQNLRLYVRLQD
jgi:hypothetical protein